MDDTPSFQNKRDKLPGKLKNKVDIIKTLT